jgi:N-acetylglucosaminyl-diphospho-decaprenol L-rhamnosyltransferase
MKVGVTFAVYNNIAHTLKCLESIYANGSLHDLYISVINNASDDGSCNKIRSVFPQVNVISNSENTGCARAWNQGIRDCISAGCEYVILTQNDVIISHGTIDNCIEYLQSHDSIKLVSPFVINVRHDSPLDISQSVLDQIAHKAKEKYPGCVYKNFCMYFLAFHKDLFSNYQFDENFKRPLFEDSDFYNSLALGKVGSCGAIDIGFMFHRYSTTQALIKDHAFDENKRYFRSKWTDELEERVRKADEEINDRIGVNMSYPTDDTAIFFDLEKSGLLREGDL